MELDEVVLGTPQPAQDLDVLLGPTAALIWKLRGLYRYQIMIKNSKAADPGGKLFAGIFADAHAQYRESHASTAVQVIVDVDAQGVL